jgi:hypothetical protein
LWQMKKTAATALHHISSLEMKQWTATCCFFGDRTLNCDGGFFCNNGIPVNDIWDVSPHCYQGMLSKGQYDQPGA